MRTRIIGLTGGIGSGKTTIAKCFESLGVPLYIADEEAKKILYLPSVIEEITNTFGPDIITNDVPDRAKLADLVFNSQEKLKLLNNIIHPKVAEHFKNWIRQQKGKTFIIKEAAILFESGSYKDCDKIILITAPKEIRIERVMIRDGVSREKVLERMKTQWDDDEKAALSDYIIENIDLDTVKRQVLEILKNLNKI